ncbi:Protein OSCP1 [Pitangus sulphuratus]|nr:Protein OSCP1 [Pitangus sulphuratus]
MAAPMAGALSAAMLAMLGRGAAAALGRARPDIPSQLDDLPPTMLKKDYANLPVVNSVDDVVRRLLSLEMASQKEKMKIKTQQLVEKVRRSPSDNGSFEVQGKFKAGRSSSAQLAAAGKADDPGCPGKAAALTQPALFSTVAVLTARIRMFEEHLQRHPKDKNNRRRMLMDMDKRKKLLGYLRRVRFDTFENTCQQLGIQYSLPAPYRRRVTKRWLVKKAFCVKLDIQSTALTLSTPGLYKLFMMNDIISTMFNRKFMEELFKPQELYSKKALRTVYDRLAHASIMRLNQASMDKLYDLMTMAFKYQVLLCPRPRDILLVTFNHLDAIKDFIYESPGILNQVDETFRQLIETYNCLSDGEFQLIRQTLLIFFQDMHIRVSIFLKDKVQNSNGRFALPTSGPVPWGTEVPGLIRIFNHKGVEVKRTEFTTAGNYVTPQREGSFELYGDRVLKLGTNMYSVSRPVETHVAGSSKNSASRAKENTVPNPLAKEELNFLARLLGGLDIQKPAGGEAGFRLNLFTTDEEEEHAAQTRPEDLSYKVINIEATQEPARREELSRILGELEVAEPRPDSAGKGEDLLALMDGL